MEVTNAINVFREHTSEYQSYDHITEGYVIAGSKPGNWVFLLHTSNEPDRDTGGFEEQKMEMMDSVEDVPEFEDIILYSDAETMRKVGREHDGVEMSYLRG